MYWNNALIECVWPGLLDPIQQSLHGGKHCLFYNPCARFDNITTNQRLADLAAWASHWLANDGIEGFAADSRNHYDIANLVKLNLWIHDIRRQGIVKPWLILDCGNGTLVAGTGDSRLRCLERIPEIQSIPAFVATTQNRAHLYCDLEPVNSLDQFANFCGAVPSQQFLFRLTDKDAPYGLEWYEYNSDRTRSVTPAQDHCVTAFVKYAKVHSTLVIDPAWFDCVIDWQNYLPSIQ